MYFAIRFSRPFFNYRILDMIRSPYVSQMSVSSKAIVGLLPVNVAGLSSILVPVVAMISGAWVHGEPLGPLQLAAMACCAAALWLALVKPSTRSP